MFITHGTPHKINSLNVNLHNWKYRISEVGLCNSRIWLPVRDSSSDIFYFAKNVIPTQPRSDNYNSLNTLSVHVFDMYIALLFLDKCRPIKRLLLRCNVKVIKTQTKILDEKFECGGVSGACCNLLIIV